MKAEAECFLLVAVGASRRLRRLPFWVNGAETKTFSFLFGQGNKVVLVRRETSDERLDAATCDVRQRIAEPMC